MIDRTLVAFLLCLPASGACASSVAAQNGLLGVENTVEPEVSVQGEGKAKPTEEQEKKPGWRSYLLEDERGAGRGRLSGAGLLGEVYSEDESWVRLGGYFDLEYHDAEDSNRRFRAHRLVPLIEAQVSRNVRFQTEIEIEDGGDVGVEFAHLDWRLKDWTTLRVGVILLPLGKLNLVHDSPIQELTDRPLMHKYVIPTTLRDTGAGVHGSWTLDEESGQALDYELYVHSGFRGQIGGTYLIDRSNGLRPARPHRRTGGLDPYEDNNNSVAFTSRVDLSAPGWEIGLSGYHGSWDEAGDLDLSMAVLDIDVTPAALPAFEDTVLADWRFLFEGALGDLERDAAARAGGVPGTVSGWYGQWSWAFAPNFLTTGEDPLFEKGGRITAILRHGRIDLDGGRRERTTIGFNLRPNEDRTVIKFEYQWNREGGDITGKHNDAFVASVATYF